MYDVIRCQGYTIALLYFITLIVMGNFILLNLFLAILLGKFETDIETIEAKKNKRRSSSILRSTTYQLSPEGRSLYIFGPENCIRKA
jgi:hypothetical protein